MVKLKKEMTHIYHGTVNSALIEIGAARSVNTKQTQLFEKSLALTQDLKRLPFLLGGKIYFWLDAHALYNVALSGLVGLGFTAVLINGSYQDEDFDTVFELFANEQAVSDILMICHGNFHYHLSPLMGIDTELEPSHWDFEGNVVLYDTITLCIFLDADTNVSTTDYLSGKIKGQYELEIDWRPFSSSELQEFIMEHIYAKQGD